MKMSPLLLTKKNSDKAVEDGDHRRSMEKPAAPLALSSMEKQDRGESSLDKLEKGCAAALEQELTATTPASKEAASGSKDDDVNSVQKTSPAGEEEAEAEQQD
ncbi:unnamed protein product [Urochloa humidicola]